MSKICAELHHLFNSKKRFYFPFNELEIPLDGIYILFEKGEYAHGGDRIVRVGTHTGMAQLRSRLKQHFINENKDRSIFRKNIGRCLLNMKKDPYLKIWELDLTTRKAKSMYGSLVDNSFQESIEKEITSYMKTNFSFCVFRVDDKNKRLNLEKKLISTISLCNECAPSIKWLGLNSPIEKIRASGLWNVQDLYNESQVIKETDDFDNVL